MEIQFEFDLEPKTFDAEFGVDGSSFDPSFGAFQRVIEPVDTDKTLTLEDVPADAKAVGVRFAKIETEVGNASLLLSLI